MGWLYMSSMRGHKTPKQYLDYQFTHEGEWALEWRVECRRRLARVLPKAGQAIVLKTPMQFSDKTTQSRFRVLEREVR